MTKRIVQVGNYSRVVELITVEFVCQHCRQAQSYTMYPGPTPKWCFACYREVRREQARQKQNQANARSDPLDTDT